MLRSTFRLPSETPDLLSAKRAIPQAIKAFWRFSLYYGQYISTPVGKRR